jgi:hypothetical protein
MSKYVNFNESAYTRDLKKSFMGVLNNFSRLIFKQAQRNLAELKVRKVDAKYQSSFASALMMTNRLTSSRYTKQLFMNNSGVNQSFRALYYEYGTGQNMRPKKSWSPSGDSSWNPVRPKSFGSKIYYRDAPWTDLGGNPHKAAVKQGRKLLIPRKNIYGHPVQAQFWFANALKSSTKNLDVLVLQAVKSVPLTAYIKIRDVRVRM